MTEPIYVSIIDPDIKDEDGNFELLRMEFLRWGDYVIVSTEPLPIYDSNGKLLRYDAYAKHLNETVAICKKPDGRVITIKPDFIIFD